MIYNETKLENGIEIESVSDYLNIIHGMNKDNFGSTEEICYRGQETEFWTIEPSIFRDNMLSIEHRLMSIPLQKLPSEFHQMKDKFEIMTKYQHYGLCTRLLDLTLNPLVALYFACKSHGEEQYKKESEEGVESIEPFGTIYFKKTYPLLSNDLKVKIATSLAYYDLSDNGENTLEKILYKLYEDEVISSELKNEWLSSEHYKDFIKIIQDNYLVLPTYSNDRLSKQNGIFLIATTFSVFEDRDYKNSIVKKSIRDLRDEFDEQFFYVNGENKESILSELDSYGINESSLFPELEHQLRYIKDGNKKYTISVESFNGYQKYESIENLLLPVDNKKLNSYILDKIYKFLIEFVDLKDAEGIQKIIENNMVIDWYKKNSTSSRIKLGIKNYYSINKKDINYENLASKVLTAINESVKEYMEKNHKEED